MNEELLGRHVKSITTSPSTCLYSLVGSVNKQFVMGSIKRSLGKGCSLLLSRNRENTCDTLKTKLGSIARMSEKYVNV